MPKSFCDVMDAVADRLQQRLLLEAQGLEALKRLCKTDDPREVGYWLMKFPYGLGKSFHEPMDPERLRGFSLAPPTMLTEHELKNLLANPTNLLALRFYIAGHKHHAGWDE
ncbi:MAG: hypothetical protein HOO67_02060 [Candidatus Peribacteraceae bacterium]|nr:hypothetical protein [Candidatus Peribacteraceae bacterium]